MKGVVSLTVVLGLTSAAQQTTQVITVHDPRPLSEAILSLEKASGQSITYEDPSYSYPGDVVDMSDSYRHKPGVRVLIPRGGPLNFSFTTEEVSSDRTTTAKVIQRLVDTFNEAYPSGTQFTLLDQGGLFHVFPTSSRSSGGGVLSHTSPLDAPLTVKVKGVNGLEALNVIFAAVKAATGTEILDGQIPLNMLAHTTLSLSTDKETGRAVLTQMLRIVGKGGPSLSWQMLRGAGEDSACYFNLHQLRRWGEPLGRGPSSIPRADPCVWFPYAHSCRPQKYLALR